MKSRNAAIWGGLVGLVAGAVLLPDVSGAPIFGMLVLGFASYECAWTMRTIKKTKTISKSLKNKSSSKSGKKRNNEEGGGPGRT